MSEAAALAHPNVALSKYWGKRPGDGRFPAVPSLSVTLAGLVTCTRVRFDRALVEDRVLLNGQAAGEGACARVIELLDRVRTAAGEARRAGGVSRNAFPTATRPAPTPPRFPALPP